MSFTYANVDGSDDPTNALDWQDRINAWPAIRAYKECTYRRIGDERPVLDAGCGTGGDAVQLHAYGVDRAVAMCERARGRGIDVARADVARLPFAHGTFAGVRCDRVLQHVDDPVAAVRELLRVTREGGRVVVADPDQQTLTIRIPGAPDALVAGLVRRRRDDGYRNGNFISQVPALLADLGARDITDDAFPLELTDPDDAFGLPTWPSFWGIDAPGWDECMGRARREPGFLYAVTYFVVAATR